MNNFWMITLCVNRQLSVNWKERFRNKHNSLSIWPAFDISIIIVSASAQLSLQARLLTSSTLVSRTYELYSIYDVNIADQKVNRTVNKRVIINHATSLCDSMLQFNPSRVSVIESNILELHINIKAQCAS